MQLAHKTIWLAAAIVLGCCGVAAAEHGPYVVPHCYSPLGVPCVPQRVTYNYFPTIWRRWPTEQAASAVPRQPEALPTPAEESVMEPSGPNGPAAQPSESPLAPPFEEGPIEAPFGPPFDDAPPGLPDEGGKTTEPAINARPPANAIPSELLPPPGGPPTPDTDLPPTMPDDDPFKDEPDAEPGIPSGAAPQSGESTLDDINLAPQQAAAVRSIPDGAPPPPPNDVDMPEMPPDALSTTRESTADAVEFYPQQTATAWPISGGALPLPSEGPPAATLPDEATEPQRLELDGDHAGPNLLPDRAMRSNPLRSASQTKRRRPIVPTASFSAAEGAVAPVDHATWRRNPLRPN